MYKLGTSHYPIECDRCDLCITNHFRPVASFGEDSKVIIVTEAPGSNERRRGVAATGPSGKLILDCLTEYNVLKYCYITYAVKCFPPMSRTPTELEVQRCSIHLTHEIVSMEPRIIVLLGAIAVESVMGVKYSSIKKPSVHKTKSGNYFLVGYHPSYSLKYSDTIAEFKETFHMLSVMVHDLINPLNEIV